ncbi:hypothetical protein ABGB17_38450, partial [Sphaerisporangium sp. B11E5]|uniref:hypothetical protein n=1 Tax=Sphaerisporangium sp. B11E5 TaxID=3153563 RepID=UPI00325DCB6B
APPTMAPSGFRRPPRRPTPDPHRGRRPTPCATPVGALSPRPSAALIPRRAAASYGAMAWSPWLRAHRPNAFPHRQASSQWPGTQARRGTQGAQVPRAFLPWSRG